MAYRLSSIGRRSNIALVLRNQKQGSLQDQANKSTGRMPWHQLPTKDAAICEKLRGAESRHRASDLRMGKPDTLTAYHSHLNKIEWVEGTPGTETSKYREEKKENSIPLVVASEEGRGQTRGLRTLGVEGRQREAEGDLNTEGKRDQRR